MARCQISLCSSGYELAWMLRKVDNDFAISSNTYHKYVLRVIMGSVSQKIYEFIIRNSQLPLHIRMYQGEASFILGRGGYCKWGRFPIH